MTVTAKTKCTGLWGYPATRCPPCKQAPLKTPHRRKNNILPFNGVDSGRGQDRIIRKRQSTVPIEPMGFFGL